MRQLVMRATGMGPLAIRPLLKRVRWTRGTPLAIASLITCCRAAGQEPCSGSRLPEAGALHQAAVVDSELVVRAAEFISRSADGGNVQVTFDSTFGSEAPLLLETLAIDTSTTIALAARGLIGQFVPWKAAVLLALRPGGIDRVDNLIGSLARAVDGHQALSFNQVAELLALTRALDSAVPPTNSTTHAGAIGMLCMLRRIGSFAKGDSVPKNNAQLQQSAAADMRVSAIARLLSFLERADRGWDHGATSRYLENWPVRTEPVLIRREIARIRGQPS